MPRYDTEKALENDETIINALTAIPSAPQVSHFLQLSANAELRARFLREVLMIHAAIPSASARWKAERRLFSVPSEGYDHYPAFQFTGDGQPLPTMREVLEIFADLTDWQIALWFFAPNAWLGNEPPMNVLQRDPEAVIHAARRGVELIEV